MKLSLRLLSALSVLCLIMPPRLSNAQALGFLDKVFSRVTDVDAEYITGSLIRSRGMLSDSSSKLQGVGVEVIIGLGRLAKKKDCPTPGKDTTLTQIKVSKGGADSIKVYTLSNAAKPDTRCAWAIGELGFGYTQVRGFRGDSSIQGSIEELPALSFYLTGFPNYWVSPYVGGRIGFTQLHNFTASVSGEQLSASGSTFEYGFLAGFSVNPPKTTWAIFAEWAWKYRDFGGVNWSGSTSGFIPSDLRTALQPWTRSFAIGGQISLGSAPKP